MTDLRKQYRSKLRTAQEVVAEIGSGARIFYGEFVLRPHALDEALAKRVPDLRNVEVEGVCIASVPACVQADPLREHILFNDWHFSAADRRLFERGLCRYIPLTYHEGPRIIANYRPYDYVFVLCGPMDSHGYLNFGLGNSLTPAAIANAGKIIVEVNRSVPRCLGGHGESLHVSEVDAIVEGPSVPLPQIAPRVPTAIDTQIANVVLEHVVDGACLQLGIGGLPSIIGSLIASSDLKDLGVHTEMFTDSLMELHLAGKITGSRKTIDRGKMVYTFAMGTAALYDFLNDNAACASYPVDYTNDPKIIALNDNVIAINNALEVDLYSQVSSETIGTTQISGTGGQLDFISGAFHSEGGKGIIGLSSTYTDKDGQTRSRIVPTLSSGSVVTVPRSTVHYVATEYGIAQLKGKSTSDRAAALIAIAHPDFRDQLAAQAREMGIGAERVWDAALLEPVAPNFV